ncbi:MAG: hypothetical protein L0Y56_22615, partial [Nitrospira sp.]|nr:hypothetical protein [Nitrospira sp.]
GASDRSIKLWEVDSGTLARVLEGHSRYVTSVAFSPDGKYIASGSADKTLKLWRVENGRVVHTFEGHSDLITSIAFSPDSKYLVSGSRDHTVKIWDVEKGRRIQTLAGHSFWVYSVGFSPDGKYIVSGSGDTTAKIWSLDNGKLLLSLLALNDGNWIAYTPDGHYSSSEKASQYIAWRAGNKIYDPSPSLDKFSGITISAAVKPILDSTLAPAPLSVQETPPPAVSVAVSEVPVSEPTPAPTSLPIQEIQPSTVNVPVSPRPVSEPTLAPTPLPVQEARPSIETVVVSEAPVSKPTTAPMASQPTGDTLAPTIILSPPQQQIMTVDDHIFINGRVEDVSEIAEVLINGIPVLVAREKGLIKPEQQKIREFSYRFGPLKMGTNAISIVASDSAGNVRTIQLQVIRQQVVTAETPKLFDKNGHQDRSSVKDQSLVRKGYAVIIGIGKYDHPSV